MLFKRMKQRNVLSEEMFDFSGGAISATDPDHAGRKSAQCQKRVKVGVLRDECEAVVFGEGPDSKVARFTQTHIDTMSGIRKDCCEGTNERWGEVVIK